jgi:hypothetical protein
VSELDCTRPTVNVAAYDLSNPDENFDTFSVTNIFCATGFEGTAAATKCVTAGEPYTVSGCSEIVCTQPTTSGYNFTDVTEALTFNTFAVTGVTCATGYEGTPTTAKCTSSGAYSVSGCTDIVCTRPTDSKYNFSGVTAETLTVSGFAVTGLTCASGFEGTASATVCSNTGDAYTVSGCVEEVSPTCQSLKLSLFSVVIFVCAYL